MKWLSALVYPVVRLLSLATEGLLRLSKALLSPSREAATGAPGAGPWDRVRQQPVLGRLRRERRQQDMSLHQMFSRRSTGGALARRRRFSISTATEKAIAK